MAEQSDQERTEEPTSRRLEQAKEKGQVARSKELASMLVLLGGVISLMWFGADLAKQMQAMMRTIFTLSREDVFDFARLGIIALNAVIEIAKPLAMVLALLFFVGILGATAVGGISVSWSAAMPKFSKLSPLSGFKRMFGLQSWVELAKSLLKVLLVGGVAVYLIWSNAKGIYDISQEPVFVQVPHVVDLLLGFLLFICSSLMVVVAIDVPFQLWQHQNQLKMTKQEIKDEYKDMEGKPEVKGRIRMLQREMAQRRMMANVPTADVIIVNPEHYSVALRYDSKKDSAPVVVAKGTDFVALKIREIASSNNISILRTPALTRAVYYSTELDQQIPDGLFVAVAQVLAYVFQLRQYQKRKGRKPNPLSEKQLPIPPELRR
ncbi:MAG: flagellar biosynthesis protein FlhB [Enterovibrio sp.]